MKRTLLLSTLLVFAASAAACNGPKDVKGDVTPSPIVNPGETKPPSSPCPSPPDPARIEKLETEVNRLNNENAALKQDNKALTSRASGLKDRFRSANKLAVQIADKNKRIKSIDEEINRTQDEITEFQARICSGKIPPDEKRTIERKLRVKEGELGGLNQEKATLVQERENLESELSGLTRQDEKSKK